MASVQMQNTIPFSNPFQVLSKNETNDYLGESSKASELYTEAVSERSIGDDCAGEDEDLPQPVVTEITNDSEDLFQDMKKKKRDFTETINLILKSGSKDQQMKNTDVIDSCNNEGSMVTVVKFQNGEFVKSPTSLPTYNSQLSLDEMRQAITTSLESCLEQPSEGEQATTATTKKSSQRSQSNSPKSRKSPSPLKAPTTPPKVASPPKVTTPPKEKTKSPAKAKVTNTTATITTAAAAPSLPQPNMTQQFVIQPLTQQLPPSSSSQPTMVKVKKEPSIKPAVTKKPKIADLESIKFANRQKELQKMKQEMKKKMKMEGTNPADIEALRSNLGSWGRTVGVLCTMCGNHVQKSYGCFRRDNAPPKLLYLFTPGMNRIKICRRCLPYKKQGNPEELKKMAQTTVMVNSSMIPSTGQMGGVFPAGNHMSQTVGGVSTITRPEHGLSTIDPSGLNLTPTMNDGGSIPNTMQPLTRPHMVIGETPSGEPMNYHHVPMFDGKSPLPNYHSVPVPAENPPNFVTTTTTMDGTFNTTVPPNYTIAQQMATNYQTNQHLPAGSHSLIGHQPPSNTIHIPSHHIVPHQPPTSTTLPASIQVNQQVNNQITIPQKQPAVHQQTPTTITHQVPGSHLQPPQGIVYQQTANTTTVTGLQDGKMINPPSWPPFIVKQIPANGTSTQMIPLNTSKEPFSYQKAGNQPLKGPLFLQIQKVKVLKTSDGEPRKLELINVRSAETNEDVSSVSNIVTKCKACANVAKTLHCINKNLSPVHLKQLFSSDQELLVVCQKCLTTSPSQVHGEKPTLNMVQPQETRVQQQQQGVDEDMRGTQGDQQEVIADQQVVTVDQQEISVGNHAVAVGESGNMMDTQHKVSVDQLETVVDHERIAMDQAGTSVGRERITVDSSETNVDQAGTMVDQAEAMVDQAGTSVDQERIAVDQAGTIVDQVGTIADQAGFVKDGEDGLVHEGKQVLCEDEPKVIVDKMGAQAWMQGDNEGIEVVNENKEDDLWMCSDSRESTVTTEDGEAVSRDSIGVEEGSSGVGDDGNIVTEEENDIGCVETGRNERMGEDDEIMASIEKLYAEEVQKENDDVTKWNNEKGKGGKKRGRKRKNREEVDGERMTEEAKNKAIPVIPLEKLSSRYHNTRGAVLKYQKEEILKEPVAKRKRGRKPKNEEIKNTKQNKQSPTKKAKT